MKFTVYSTRQNLRRDHAGELHLADAKRSAASLHAAPAEIETGELPQRVEAEAARHHGIPDEMAGKEPEVRADVEFGHDMALPSGPPSSEIAVIRSNISIGGAEKLGIARAEHLAPRAGQQALVVDAARPIGHVGVA